MPETPKQPLWQAWGLLPPSEEMLDAYSLFDDAYHHLTTAISAGDENVFTAKAYAGFNKDGFFIELSRRFATIEEAFRSAYLFLFTKKYMQKKPNVQIWKKEAKPLFQIPQERPILRIRWMPVALIDDGKDYEGIVFRYNGFYKSCNRKRVKRSDPA